MDLDIHFGQWRWLVLALSETKKFAPGTSRDLLAEVMKVSLKHCRLCRMASFSVSHLDTLGKPNWNAWKNKNKTIRVNVNVFREINSQQARKLKKVQAKKLLKSNKLKIGFFL